MKEMLPTGMVRRGNRLIARVDVPRELVPIIGKTSLKHSHRTGDLAIAKVRHYPVMAEFERVLENARKRLRGEPVSSPADDVIGTIITIDMPFGRMPGDGKPKVPMQQVFDEWKLAKQPRANTVAEYQRSMDLFIAQNGKLAVRYYTKDHARKWRDHVVAMPDLAHSTREKWFGSIKTLFRFADDRDYLDADPFDKVKLDTPNRPKVARRQEWEPDQLKAWFASPIYTERFRPKAGAGEASFWLPILGLYHGFRLAEMCQLRRIDMVAKDGVEHCLKIRPSAEDDDGPERSVKTPESERTVPLHKSVIELGFLDYLDTLKGKQMFPLIRPDVRGRWSGHWSKWFGRYRRSIGLDQRWVDFHSFRHTWKTAARAAKIPREYHDEISGHEDGSVSSTYGNVPANLLKEELDQISFDVTIPKWKAP